jgi:hypothetical protein
MGKNMQSKMIKKKIQTMALPKKNPEVEANSSGIINPSLMFYLCIL